MKAIVFLLSEMGNHKGVTCSHLWFTRTLLAVVLRMNFREALNAECTLVKDTQREVEKNTPTSRFPV